MSEYVHRWAGCPSRGWQGSCGLAPARWGCDRAPWARVTLHLLQFAHLLGAVNIQPGLSSSLRIVNIQGLHCGNEDSHRLWRQHPVWALLHVRAAPLPMQLPANACGEVMETGPRARGRPKETSESWLLISAGRPRQLCGCELVAQISISLYCNSFKQINLFKKCIKFTLFSVH